MIAIVDTGGANIASVRNACLRLNQAAELTSDLETISRASHVILPGVGAAASAMDRIQKNDLTTFLKELKRPTLGICLGMQLLFERSQEGGVACLGLFEGSVQKLIPEGNLPVPHMGWNQVVYEKEKPSVLFKDIPDASYFYFVHSFVAPRTQTCSASFIYGGSFPAAVEQNHFFGVQFHPERSGEEGAKVLKNFFSL